jgi:hypothetical protein
LASGVVYGYDSVPGQNFQSMTLMSKENVRDWGVVFGQQLNDEVNYLGPLSPLIGQSEAAKSRE